GVMTTLVVLLLLLAGGAAAAYLYLGPERIKAVIATITGKQGTGPESGAGAPNAVTGQPPVVASSGTPAAGTPAPTQAGGSALVFPGVALRRLVPSDVKVFVSGRNFSLTPFLFRDEQVDAGDLTLVFERQGYVQKPITFAIAADGKIEPPLITLERSLQHFELEDRIRKTLERAQEALRDKRYERAVELFREVADEAPSYDQARVALEDAEREQEEVESALSRGRTYLNQKRWPEAIEMLRRIPMNWSRAGEAQGYIATAETKLAQGDSLKKQIRGAIEGGRYDEAQALVKELENLLPIGATEPKDELQSVEIARRLFLDARREFENNRFESANAAFDKLKTVSPNHEAFRPGGLHSRVVEELGRRNSAQAEVDKNLAEAREAIGQNQYGAAMSAAARVLAADPGNAEAEDIKRRAKSAAQANMQAQERTEIENVFRAIDRGFKAGDKVEVLGQFSPQSQAYQRVERELSGFFSAPIAVVDSQHSGFDIVAGGGGEASVSCTWDVTLRFSGVDSATPPVRSQVGVRIAQQFSLTKAGSWKITDVQQVGDAVIR
ncbi:MAG: tetratricopeptide repeat protein, partial [Planctomycetota bacterium]